MLASVLQAASPQNGAGHFICHSCPRHQNQHVQTSVCDFLIYLPTDAACDGCKTLILRVWRHCGQRHSGQFFFSLPLRRRSCVPEDRVAERALNNTTALTTRASAGTASSSRSPASSARRRSGHQGRRRRDIADLHVRWRLGLLHVLGAVLYPGPRLPRDDLRRRREVPVRVRGSVEPSPNHSFLRDLLFLKPLLHNHGETFKH